MNGKEVGTVDGGIKQRARTCYLGVSILLQLLLLSYGVQWFCRQFPLLRYGFGVVQVFCVIAVIGSKKEASFQICWLLLLLPFPVVGTCLFFLWGGFHLFQNRNARQVDVGDKECVEERTQKEWEQLELHDRLQLAYLEREMGYEGFYQSKVTYCKSGEETYEVMKELIKKAEHYIFLEYFIIKEGVFWNELLTLLSDKAKDGVEVRVLYDDVGCLFTLPENVRWKLKEVQMKACAFHPLKTIMTPKWNQRNHRKLFIVDGVSAMTGGVNIADEYINVVSPYGHWKDCGLLVEGLAAWAMTETFLDMWGYSQGTQGVWWQQGRCENQKLKEEKEKYFPAHVSFFQVSGVILPYNEVPDDHEMVARQVILNLITRATRFIYITTPYLILDAMVENALCQVAKMGVTVKIITPAIADKKLVHQVTRGQYAPLLQAGVEIYEYQGFIHGKTVVVDGKFATVGTVNLDFRSLFLHFEQGVWMYRTPCIKDIEQDFLETLEKSKRYDKKQWSYLERVLRAMLRVFAPFM